MSMAFWPVQKDRPYENAPTYIGCGSGPLSLRWRELWSYRELLYFMVWRDITVRYRHTVLGIAWAVLQPLLTMAVFTIVFGRLADMPSNGQPYALFALAALTPWTYIVTSVTTGANALVGSEHLISKVYFPRLLIPTGAILTPLIDLMVTMVLLAAAMTWFGVVPSRAIVLLPLFVLLAAATALAASLWLSAMNVLYRDVRFVVPFLLQFWMFASPVVYPASGVPEQWRFVYGLNPAATVIEGFRWAVLGTELSAPMAVASVLSVVVALAGGLIYFRRMEGTFADVL
jgi:lipopolysaccharide transport system permease protein